MVLCEMYHARQSPRPVLIKSLQKSSFIGRISQYFPFREVCDWSVLTKLSLCMGLVPVLPPHYMQRVRLVPTACLSFIGILLGGMGRGWGGGGDSCSFVDYRESPKLIAATVSNSPITNVTDPRACSENNTTHVHDIGRPV